MDFLKQITPISKRRVLFSVLSLSFFIEILYKLYKRRRRATGKAKVSPRTQTIWFPDTKLVNRGLRRRLSSESSEDVSSYDGGPLTQLADVLNEATRTLDLCVYCFTSQFLGDVVIGIQGKGVVVRFITDLQQMGMSKCQVDRLLKAGVSVRHNKGEFLMHNKYAILDGTTVLTGSFNWTNNATVANHENIVVLDLQQVVEDYKKNFETLWNKFDYSKKSNITTIDVERPSMSAMGL